MSYHKRSRAAYEADLHHEAASHVTFGTPLPPLDSDVRDDGSYVPLHKQEVRDDRGRRRLHGAFTGGWSAGYFNTVGSKEGWTPAAFVSSRTNRRKDDPRAAFQRPEDYMDDEDLADAAAAQEIRTTDPFAAIGASSRAQSHGSGLAGLMRIQGDTVGLTLLRKMGWKDGQGIGPKIRRKARLGVSTAAHHLAAEETHLFAPEDVDMIAFSRKADHRGLGYEGEARLSPTASFADAQGHRLTLGDHRSNGYAVDDGDGDGTGVDGPAVGPKPFLGTPSRDKKQKQGQRGGFGVGVLNDTGSDEDDPYEMGPRISYNRVLGGDKAKKKKKPTNGSVPANPTLRSKPVFISKSATATQGRNGGKCLDGKLPLNGFTLGQSPNSRVMGQSARSYPVPAIPAGWVSARHRVSTDTSAAYVSTADAAKAAHHNPRSRAAILGESSLPGKSVFDYMSAASRERLVAASGRANLPPARGEMPREQGRPAGQPLQERLRSLPSLAKETAIAAMSRGAGAGGPYANDDEKRGRYRLYLQNAAGFSSSSPDKPSGMTNDEFIKELEEFYGCAQLFKPMTGFMATRFTTASTGSRIPTDPASEAGRDMKTRHGSVPTKPHDAAEEAAKMGMYGRMTRLTEDFFPTRLLCKRFNVRPPAHVQPDSESGVAPAVRSPPHPLPGGTDMMDKPTSVGPRTAGTTTLPGSDLASESLKPGRELPGPSRGDVVGEATRPGDEVFKAIFGDSSDEEE